MDKFLKFATRKINEVVAEQNAEVYALVSLAFVQEPDGSRGEVVYVNAQAGDDRELALKAIKVLEEWILRERGH